MKTSLEQLEPLMRCSVCNRRHKSTKAVLLREDDEQTAFHLTCASCGVSSMVFVSNNQFGVVSMGMLTDLAGEEVGEIYGSEPVSGEQVLDVYAFLKDFHGDAQALVREMNK